MTLLQSNRGIFEGLADASHPRIHLDLVKKLLGRRILFHPVFVTITGSVTASLMLSQSLYWTRTWLTQPEQLLVNGWFWKSAKEWQDETGLSRREQETARKTLREINFLEEKKQGMPAKSFYRIDLNRIANSIHPASEIDWDDDAIVFELLGSPISFHRCLVDFTDSATASLMLSHAIGLTAKILNKRPDGWFWKSVKEWQDETGLSRHEQVAARKMLREIGLISEKRTPANQTITNFKVDLDRLKSLLLQTHTTAPDSIGIGTPESANLVCGKPANRNAGKRQPCMRETSKQERRKAPTLYAGNQQTGTPESANLVCGKPANRNAGKRQPWLAESGAPDCTKPAFLYTGITTGITKPLQPRAEEVERQAGSRSAQDLIFPKQLDPILRDAIGRRLIAECPHDAQAILDVMAHTYQTQAKGVSSPVGWVNSMVSRVKRQTFDPLPGLTIAAARAERQRRETALIESDRREKQAIQQAGTSPLPPAPDTPRDRRVSQEANAFFESFRARKENFVTPAADDGSPNDARQASPLMQQKALTKNSSTPLISSVRKLKVS